MKFDISVGVGAFVIGLSQISSFFSYLNKPCNKKDFEPILHRIYVFAPADKAANNVIII